MAAGVTPRLRSLWRLATLAMACTGWAASGVAQPFPSRPMTLVSPVPPGGAVDRITRAWMDCAQARAGQPIVLHHRPGGNGVVAVGALRQAPADGHTLMVAGMSQTTIVPFVFPKRPFDPEKDLQGAAVFASSPYLLVASAQSGIRSWQDLQVRARSQPRGIDVGIPNIATPAHILSAALVEHLGGKATFVPTGGEAGGVTALIGGHIPVMVFVPGTIAAQVESGQFVPLLAFTARRLSKFPHVPTVVEATGDASLVRQGWLGIATRSGTPAPVLASIDAWTRDCMNSHEFQAALATALVTPHYLPPAEMADLIRRDIDFWSPWIARLELVPRE